MDVFVEWVVEFGGEEGGRGGGHISIKEKGKAIWVGLQEEVWLSVFIFVIALSHQLIKSQCCQFSRFKMVLIDIASSESKLAVSILFRLQPEDS